MNPHPPWCARGHRCGLGEHRANPLSVRRAVVLTRVRTSTGREYAEIRLRLALPADEPTAQHRLAALLARIDRLLTR